MKALGASVGSRRWEPKVVTVQVVRQTLASSTPGP